jgi:hypothetical protein
MALAPVARHARGEVALEAELGPGHGRAGRLA